MTLATFLSGFRKSLPASRLRSNRRSRLSRRDSSVVRCDLLEVRTLLTPASGLTIGDFVWNDLNADGLQDKGEPGIPDVTINLLDEFGGGPIETTTTDTSGEYCFVDLEPVSYIVEFVLPSGFAFTTQNVGSDDTIDSDANTSTGRVSVDVTSGSNNLTVDAGMRQASIGDFVWNDGNGDGVQDAGEPGLAGVTVYVDRNSPGILDGDDPFAVTDSNGMYRIDGLASGTHRVTVESSTLPSGFVLTSGNDPQSVTVSSGEHFDNADFGYRQLPTRITGRKWHDLDGNGSFDPGEPGIDGVTVRLLDDQGDVVDTFVTTTIDQENDGIGPEDVGHYELTAAMTGIYTVEEVVPVGWVSSTPDLPDIIVEEPGGDIPGPDIGNFVTGSIHGFKFHDVDGDGRYDVDRTVIAGVDTNADGKADTAESPVSAGGALELTDGSPVIEVYNQDGNLLTAQIRYENITNRIQTDGGSFTAGTQETFDADMVIEFTGTGAAFGAGYTRTVTFGALAVTIDHDVRQNGAAVQTFHSEFRDIDVMLPPGDADFDLLHIRAGITLGPSVGETTLRRLPGTNDFQVDSFFDISYEFEFLGNSTGAFGALNGSSGVQQQQVSPIGNTLLDLPLDGVVFTLTDPNGNAVNDANGNPVAPQTTSDLLAHLGEFWFTELLPGEYLLSETVPPGWTATTPVSQQLTISSGQELAWRPGAAMLQDIRTSQETDFEGLTGSDVTIGADQLTARLHGDGIAGEPDDPELIVPADPQNAPSTGASWTIGAGGTGLLTFPAPVDEVEFFAAQHSTASSPTRVSVFDPNNVIMDSFFLTIGDSVPLAADSFFDVAPNPMSGQPMNASNRVLIEGRGRAIGRIEFSNQSTAGNLSDRFGIDNLRFTRVTSNPKTEIMAEESLLFGNTILGSVHLLKFEDINADGDSYASGGCVVPDNGSGTVNLPPTGCSYVFERSDSPQGRGVLDAYVETLSGFSNVTSSPGGSLGGEIITFDALVELSFVGAGATNHVLPVSGIMYTGPRIAGDEHQRIKVELVSLSGQLSAPTADFQSLTISAGNANGIARTNGTVTLNRLPSGAFLVDSFFDITYQVDYTGAAGSHLDGVIDTDVASETIRIPAADTEPGVPGVQFQLTGTDSRGNQVNSTLSDDGSGNYSAVDLWPGIYTVTEAVPSGWISTTHKGLTPPSTTFPIFSGQELAWRDDAARLGAFQTLRAGTDFEGLPGGDIVVGENGYRATLRNGNVGKPDPGRVLSGTHAWILDAGNTATISFEQPATTVSLFFSHSADLGIDGELTVTVHRVNGTSESSIWPAHRHRFYDPVAAYLRDPGKAIERITFSLPSGANRVIDDLTYAVTFPETRTEVVVGDELIFGNARPGSIHGLKFEDVNANGLREPGEPLLPGWQMGLYDATTGFPILDPITNQPIVVTTMSDDPGTPIDETGMYWFEDVPPGRYRVDEIQRSGWQQSVPVSHPFADVAYRVDRDLGLGPEETQFRNRTGADEKWFRGIPNQFGNEWYTLTPDGTLREWDETNTASGAIVTSLNSDYYRKPTLLTDARPANPVIAVNSGAVVSGPDFGNYVPGSIHGFKFEDVDGDGIYDPAFDRPMHGITFEVQAYADTVVIDDGESRFFTQGDFSESSGSGFQEDEHISAAGSGSDTASWNLTVAPGEYKVAATWTPAAGRATDSPFTVFDGASSLATIRVNQRAAPSGLSLHGTDWTELGTFTVTGTQLVVQLSNDANGQVVADALLLIPVGPHATPYLTTIAEVTTNEDGEFHVEGLKPGATGSSVGGFTVREVVPRIMADGRPLYEPTTDAVFQTDLLSRQELVWTDGAAMLPSEDPRTEVVVGKQLMFGNTIPGSFHGFKFEDMDGDGTYEPNDGDVGMPGVEFELVATDGRGNRVVRRVTSDAAGEFHVTGLPPSVDGRGQGTGYTLTETVPAGSKATTQTVRKFDLQSGQELVWTNGAATLSPEITSTEDFDNALPGMSFFGTNPLGIMIRGDGSVGVPADPQLAIGSQAWLTDANGLSEITFESPAHRVQLDARLLFNAPGELLITAFDTLGFPLVARDANGTPLTSGTVAIVQAPASSTDPFTTIQFRGGPERFQRIARIELVSNSPEQSSVENIQWSATADPRHEVLIGTELTFGNITKGAVHGQKYNDRNGNGIRDANEEGLNGWEFQLIGSDVHGHARTYGPVTTMDHDVNGDGVIDPVTERGWFWFEDVVEGAFVLLETPQTGWMQTAVTVGSNANQLPGDTNQDAAFDVADPIALMSHLFLGGTAPVCKEVADFDGNGSLELTDGVGMLNYLFLGGSAHHLGTNPVHIAGCPNALSGSGTASAASVLMTRPGETIDTVLVGNHEQMVTIGDFVWDDRNRNGIQDLGEPGVGDVTVNLLDLNLQQFQTKRTDSSGFYAFTVPPGQYAIEVFPPVGFTGFSPKDAGNNTRDNLDSDADSVSGRTHLFPASVTSPQDTIDIGLINDRPVIDNPDSPARDSQPEITWTPIVNVETYDVEIVNLTIGSVPDVLAHVDSFFRPSSPLAMGRYQFRVRGNYDDGQQTPWSLPIILDVRPQVDLIVDRHHSDGFPNMEWSPIEGATRYDVWIDNLTTGEERVVREEFHIDSFFRPTLELPIGWYVVWVRPHGANDYAGSWAGRSFRVATPTGVTGPIGGLINGLPTFEWKSVNGAETYDLWVRQLTPVTQDQIIREKNLTGTTFTAGDPLPPGSFVFWVQPQGTNSFQSSWGAGVTFNTFTHPVVQGPTSRNATVNSTIEWTRLQGAATYDLEVTNSSGDVVIGQIGLTTNSHVPAIPFDSGTEYHVRVRAVDSMGNPGAWSPPHRFVTRPDRVNLIGPGIGNPSGSLPAGPVRFSWDSTTGAAFYELWVNQLGGTARIIHERRLTSTDFTDSLSAGDYRFWVRAINSEGFAGPWSLALDFTVASSETFDAKGGGLLTSLSPSPVEEILQGLQRQSAAVGESVTSTNAHQTAQPQPKADDGIDSPSLPEQTGGFVGRVRPMASASLHIVFSSFESAEENMADLLLLTDE